jgi:predicted AAA+ superfamily ATPase
MKFQRSISEHILKDLMDSGKIVLVYGPRQAGKTTLSKMIIEKTGL